MPNETITITRATARRFLVQSFALDGFQTLPHVASAIDRLEFVQEDSINICGRIHDLILWARVKDYKPNDLRRALYERPRQAFEFYFPNLSVLPMRDFPYFMASMSTRRMIEGRWGALTQEELPVAQEIYSHLDHKGSIHVRESSAAHGHTTSGWGTRQKLATKVLEKMWLHGLLMIHSRDDFTRRYALAEHVLSEAETEILSSADTATTVAARVVEKLWLQGHLTVSHRANFERWFDRTEWLLPHVAALDLPHPEDEARFRVLKRLRARRLFRRQTLDRATLGDEAFVTVTLTDAPTGAKPWFALAEDANALRSENEAAEATDAAGSGKSADTVHFLAPLDPLVYDRERNRALWDFDYTWEVYTPAAKRRWGYYVLPILRGDRLIGRMDPKFDRKTGTLTVHSLGFEPGVDVREATRALAGHLRTYARWLGARAIDLSPTGLTQPQRRLLEKLK